VGIDITRIDAGRLVEAVGGILPRPSSSVAQYLTKRLQGLAIASAPTNQLEWLKTRPGSP
jgi:hypothetical protein